MTDDAERALRPSFRKGLQVQMRVLGALILREIITRYGRHNLGFLWLLAEPIIFTVGITILWNLMHKTHGLRVEVTPFIVTGYSALLLWRICSSRGLKAIEPNRSLLHHRQVKVQDIFFSRMLLEVAGVTAAFVLLMLTMIGAELLRVPDNMFLFMQGWFFMAWFSACLGTILGCLSEHSEMLERLWHPTSYFLLAASGTFFMVDWLPLGAQDLVQWVPMVHPIEMLRGGYWGMAVRTHYDAGYIFLVCLLMTLASLMLMADRRMKMLT